jgi:hypothetical protein
MSTNTYPSESNDSVGILQIFIAEYYVLRREIDIYHEHQKEIMNFLFLTLVAMISLFGIIQTEKISQFVSYVYLLFPLIFCLLTLLYTDRTVRILRIADYIHNYLRKRVAEVCGESVWQWESYKSRTPLIEKKLALVLDRTRWLVFIFPSVLAIVLFWFLSHDDAYLVGNILTILPLLLLDFAVLAVSIWAMFLVEETTGIKTRKLPDLDDFKDKE